MKTGIAAPNSASDFILFRPNSRATYVIMLKNMSADIQVSYECLFVDPRIDPTISHGPQRTLVNSEYVDNVFVSNPTPLKSMVRVGDFSTPLEEYKIIAPVAAGDQTFPMVFPETPDFVKVNLVGGDCTVGVILAGRDSLSTSPTGLTGFVTLDEEI